MIVHQSRKYPVSIQFIGENVVIDVQEDHLEIYYAGSLICGHPISHKALNYDWSDYVEILRSDVFKKILLL